MEREDTELRGGLIEASHSSPNWLSSYSFNFFICTVGSGYLKTKYYKPNIADQWDKVDILQSEVAFGQVISPVFYVLSLVGIAVICGIILILYKKLVN